MEDLSTLGAIAQTTTPTTPQLDEQIDEENEEDNDDETDESEVVPQRRSKRQRK